MQPLTLSEIRSLDDWHLQLSILQESFNRALLNFSESSDPTSYVSLFHVLNDYFLFLVDTFPMPSRMAAAAGADVPVQSLRMQPPQQTQEPEPVKRRKRAKKLSI